MIKGWIIYPRPVTETQRNNNAFGLMADAAEKNGIELKILFKEDIILICGTKPGILYKKEEVEKPLFAFIRCYDQHLSEHLETMGIRVFNNSESMFISQDKFLTHLKLCEAGIPTPLTFAGIDDYHTACCLLKSERFIMKSPYGSKGEYVFLVDNETDFNKYKGMLVQEYIEYSRGRDIRVWVTGNNVTAAVLRYNENSYLSNYSQGGSFKRIDIDEIAADLALKSAACTGLEISGIDILFKNENEYTVCEVNGNAGFRTLYAAYPEVDMPMEIFGYISSVL